MLSKNSISLLLGGLLSRNTIVPCFMPFIMMATSHAQDVSYNCNPCIDRSDYVVKVIVHGTESNSFWQQVQAAAVQAGKDMDVNLQMMLYEDGENVEQLMIDDIIAAASGADKPSALIVSIPSPKVQEAVVSAVNAGIAVFGLDTGYEAIEQDTGILDFIAMDDILAGEKAANKTIELLPKGSSVSKALFIIDDSNDSTDAANDKRKQGYSTTLSKAFTGVQVDELSLNLGGDIRGQIDSALVNCPYEAIVLSSSHEVVEAAVSAAKGQNCGAAVLGAFDSNADVHDMIVTGDVDFAISQQPHLQGALSVVMASLYATTGMRLAPPAESQGVYLSGPFVISSDNLPSDTMKICEADAFPVCPNTQSLLMERTTSECECTDRKTIKIAGVTHGVTTDEFWDPVYAAAAQAAVDMGVQLDFERFEPEDDESVLHAKMANKIFSLCQEGVDGIFVSVPSDSVFDAIKTCIKLNIPVVGINAGADHFEDLGLMHFIAQSEYNAGFSAGKKLAKACPTCTFYCLNHAEGVNVVTERCNGTRDGIADILGDGAFPDDGEIFVPADNMALYKKKVEDVVGAEGDWGGIGLLLAGQPNIEPGLFLQKSHPKVTMGAFDLSDDLYRGLDEGRMLFGIDQQAYMQGYFPIPLLTYMAYTDQRLFYQFIESGPSFIEESPSDAEQVCLANEYSICEAPPPTEISTFSDGSDSSNQVNKAAIGATVGIILGLMLIFIVYLAYRVKKLDDLVKKLREEGKDVPDLTMSQRLSSLTKPVEKIIV